MIEKRKGVAMRFQLIFLALLLLGSGRIHAANGSSAEFTLQIAAEPTVALPNQPVQFSYAVSGDAADVTIHELLLDGCALRGRSASCERAATASMAYATGWAGKPVTTTLAAATVDVLTPGIALAVAPSVAEATSGQPVQFNYTISNTGEAHLVNVTLEDEGSAACAVTLGELAPGAVTQHACSRPMASPSLTSLAQVTAAPVNGDYIGSPIQSAAVLATIALNTVPTATTLFTIDVVERNQLQLFVAIGLLLLTGVLLWRRKRLAAIGLLLLNVATVRPTLAANVCHVPAQYATIQLALNDLACDEVQVAPGFYPGNLHINRSVVLRGAPYQSVLDGQGGGSVIWVTGGELVVIDNLILQNGRAESGGGVRVAAPDSTSVHITNSVLHSNVAEFASGDNGWGGGVYNYASDVTLQNVHMQGNRAHYGGAVMLQGPGSVTLTNTSLFANSAERSGGGLMLDAGAVTIDGGWIGNNVAAERGGGLYNSGGLLEVGSSNVQANSANEGGGVYTNGPSTTLFNSSVHGNSAADGAGVLNESGVTLINAVSLTGNGGNVGVALFNRHGSISVINSSISGNVGGFGAAVYSDNGFIGMIDSGLSANRAYDGGAFYVEGGRVELVRTSIVDSVADGNGGAAFLRSDEFGGSEILIARNSGGLGGAIYTEGTSRSSFSRTAFQFNRADVNGGAFFGPGRLAGTHLSFLANEALNGGAFYGSDLHLFAGNNQFISNRAVTSGGAIALSGSAMLTGVQFDGNSAGERGGAADISADVTMSSVSFANNTARLGGAVYNTGRLTTTAIALVGNGAMEGGAVYNRGIFRLGVGNISGNRATVEGSAVWSDALAEFEQAFINGNIDAPGVHNAGDGVVNFEFTTIQNHAPGNCSGNIANINNINGLIDDDGTCQLD